MDRPQASHYNAFIETSARYLGVDGYPRVETPDAAQPAAVAPDQRAAHILSAGERA